MRAMSYIIKKNGKENMKNNKESRWYKGGLKNYETKTCMQVNCNNIGREIKAKIVMHDTKEELIRSVVLCEHCIFVQSMISNREYLN